MFEQVIGQAGQQCACMCRCQSLPEGDNGRFGVVDSDQEGQATAHPFARSTAFHRAVVDRLDTIAFCHRLCAAVEWPRTRRTPTVHRSDLSRSSSSSVRSSISFLSRLLVIRDVFTGLEERLSYVVLCCQGLCVAGRRPVHWPVAVAEKNDFEFSSGSNKYFTNLKIELVPDTRFTETRIVC